MTHLRHVRLTSPEDGRLTRAGLTVAACAALVVLVNAAVFGGWMAALAAAAVITAGVGVSVAVRRIQRFAECTSDVAEALAEVRGRIDSLEQAVQMQATRRKAAETRTIDLATFGRGDPGQIVAATLDRSQYPRLVAMMEMEPPAVAAEGDVPPGGSGDSDSQAASGRVSQKDLLRAWRIGWRNGDLEACRDVHAALVDTVDASTLARLTERMEELAEQTERTLREAFAAYREKEDLAGMLAIGRRICRLVPDRPVADEFRRIEPDLQRLVSPGGAVEIPTLKVVH